MPGEGREKRVSELLGTRNVGQVSVVGDTMMNVIGLDYF